VSTRKLIAAALLCGLAILVAGGIQLFRISDRSGRTVEVLAEGQPATVGGVRVTVDGSAIRSDGRLAVGVSLAGPSALEVPASSFTLLAGGKLQPAVGDDTGDGTDCPSTIAVSSEATRCLLTFTAHDGTATLSFSHSGEQQLWRLDPA
jgi:hypothetical protein